MTNVLSSLAARRGSTRNAITTPWARMYGTASREASLGIHARRRGAHARSDRNVLHAVPAPLLEGAHAHLDRTHTYVCVLKRILGRLAEGPDDADAAGRSAPELKTGSSPHIRSEDSGISVLSLTPNGYRQPCRIRRQVPLDVASSGSDPFHRPRGHELGGHRTARTRCRQTNAGGWLG